MKVLLVNGSPHKNGCTFTALSEVAKALTQDGIETEFFHIGTGTVHGCTACGQCFMMDIVSLSVFVQPFFPFLFPEAHQYKVLAHQNWPLHQHTVGGKKLQHFLFCHVGQLLLQLHRPIEQSAGIEELFQRQSTALIPDAQLFQAGIICFNVPKCIRNLMLVQSLLGLLTGAALGVTYKRCHWCSLLFSFCLSVIRILHMKCILFLARLDKSDALKHGL